MTTHISIDNAHFFHKMCVDIKLLSFINVFLILNTYEQYLYRMNDYTQLLFINVM